MAKPDDNYGSFGSVPRENNQGVSNAALNVRANPEAFGAGVGQAISSAGKEMQDIGYHFAQITTEAKVNDDYANKYIPAATQLKADYDSLRGQDKIGGYENYISSLKNLNKEFISSQPGILGQNSMTGMVNRYTIGEETSAKANLVESQKRFSDKARADLMLANNKLAANNYNNPLIISDVESQNDNHVLIKHIDNGYDPNIPEDKDLIANIQQNIKGQMATGMIKSAVNSGDANSANTFRSRYASVIPGYEKLHIDNIIHTENIKQTSNNAYISLTTGKPLPDAVGAPASQIQALVANTAKSSAIDPNHALTVLRIESADGQNVGTRGTLGQDKESAGKSLDEQAKALCDNLKAAGDRATQVLGRQAEPWEAYAVYQQGSGGGAALLTADINAKAIDVLRPLYKYPKDALAAINGNGGNPTMTVGDFTDHIKQVWTDNERRANCDFGTTDNPGEALLKPHQTPGITIQPGVSPLQEWHNFEKNYAKLQEQINAIPNYEERDGVKEYIESKRNESERKASAYKNALISEANQLADSPTFTSIDMIPSEMRAALVTDSRDTLTYMKNRAKENLNKASGHITKDMQEYGSDFYDLFKGIHAEPNSPDRINSIEQLQKFVGTGKLTISGYDKLVKEVQGKNTPEGEADGMMKKQFFAMAKSQISGEDPALGIRDPKGEESYLRFIAQALPAYEAGKGAGKSTTQLLNPDSSDYIGKSIPSFKRSIAQQLADMQEAYASLETPKKTESGIISSTIHNIALAVGAAPTDPISVDINTPEGLRNAVLTGKITRAEGVAEALKRGYIKSKNPTVPLAE